MVGVFCSVNTGIYSVTRIATLDWLVNDNLTDNYSLLLSFLCLPGDEQTWICLDTKSVQLSSLHMYASLP